MGPPQITKEPYEDQNVLKVKAQGTKPLMYQWFKDHLELRDGIDYKGSTTSELHLVGSDAVVKGDYSCQVTNMYGKIFSLEIHYGRFYNRS